MTEDKLKLGIQFVQMKLNYKFFSFQNGSIRKANQKSQCRFIKNQAIQDASCIRIKKLAQDHGIRDNVFGLHQLKESMLLCHFGYGW